MKELTGGDIVKGRRLYGEEMSFKPMAKLFLLTNPKPEFDVDQKAMRDRVRLIPFLARFAPSQENNAKIDNLMTNCMGEFFTWFVQGAVKWYQSGLTQPEVMVRETSAYINAIDTTQQFVDDCCDINANYNCSLSELYFKYAYWMKDEAQQSPLGKMQFTDSLLKRGFSKKKITAGWVWNGLKLSASGGGATLFTVPSDGH